MKFITFIGILAILISQIVSIIPNSIETISFNGYFSEPFDNVEEKYFQIKIALENIPKYMKINVIDFLGEKNPNYIMTFVKSLDESGEREQISSGEKSAIMWLTKDQLDKENNLLYVTCYTYPCNYNLTIESSEQIKMNFNSQFNLYVTENNKEVDVVFSPEKEDLDASYITLWGIGNKNPEVTLEGQYDSKKYSNNNIFKINPSKINDITYTLKIKAEANDVINIGSSTFDTNLKSSLINNSPEKKGFIFKDFSNQEECYNLNIDGYNETEYYYLSGIFYTKIAEIYYKNENGAIIDSTINIINNGSFIHMMNPKKDNKHYICVRFPTVDVDKYSFSEIFYSIQLTDPKQSDSKINLYSPQIYGEIYPRMLKENEIFLFTGIPISDEAKEISFNMISEFGYPDMYVDICTNYPLCNKYKYDNLDKLINPISMNGHSSYKIDLTNSTKYSPMSPNQYVIIAKCFKGIEKGIELPCGFKTIYRSNTDKVILKEKEIFSQYVKKEEKNLYKIDFKGINKVDKIYVDLMVFTGDIIFNPIESNINAKKLYMANKIFYIIYVDEALSNQEINFNVIGTKNSYYTIQYSLIKMDDDSWITNIIETGISYVITIDPKGKDSHGEIKPYKHVKFSNLKMYEGIQFLVNFNSLNCKLNVTAKRFKEDGTTYEEPINSFDQYYQDIVSKNKENDYEYKLTIDEMDSSIYDNKLCMVYASSVALDKEDFDERQIVISDNEPRQVVFSGDLKEIEYLYPHTNRDNDVVIKVNLLDIAQYQITISYAWKKNVTMEQSGNDIIYLHHNEWKDIESTNGAFPIIIKFKKNKAYEEREPKLVISVKAVQDGTPSYIKKNHAQIDFLLGKNTQYFYTDLGKGEEGDAIVNYHRGSGRLYGKIVEKNLDKPEEGANWREMYKFPETVEESLEFYGFIKKIMIRKNETEKCQEGCYLLLTLRTSVESEKYYDFDEHAFSIKIHTTTPNSGEDNIPIINIPLNEYIIGNIIIHEDKKIYEYYSTYLTHDAESILIDFQSKIVNFNIKVGANNKPTLTDKDFNFESFGDDVIFEIKKKDFLDKCKERGINIPHENSLLGLGLTIGIWTDKIDSLYTTVYSFKVNLPFHKELIIYEIQSDQKTLCKPQKVSDKGQYPYRCLFIVFYFGLDPGKHLLLYPEIQEYSPYQMHAEFIQQDRYEYFDYTYLSNNVPNKDSQYSTEKSGLEYLYIPHGEKFNQHLYVSVFSETDSVVELFTSFYTHDKQLSPNPSSPQLFITENPFSFEFVTEEDLLVTIKTICGQAKINWHSDEGVEYYLTGRDKILSLSSSIKDKSDLEKLFSNLDVTSLQKDNNCPGFAFHISHLLRPSDINLDGIPLGKSTRIAYRETDFPVYIYTEIFWLDKDVHSFINIYEVIGKMEGGLQDIEPFELSATLVNDTVIMDAKLNKKILEDLTFEYKGVYDPMIKTGYVLITKEDIKNKNIQIKDGPSVIIRVTKNLKYPNMKDTIFTRLTLEASIIQDNSEIPTPPDVYQYGKLSLTSNKNVYRLKANQAEHYMRIQFSGASDKIRYVIGKTPDDTSTFSFPDYEDKNTTINNVITFNADSYSYIFLIIYHNNEKASTDKLTNYAFKYMTSESKDGFIEYKLNSDQGFELDKKEDGDYYIYTFKITPLSYDNVDITYLIKFTDKADWIENEKDTSIALRESKSYVEELKNIEKKDGKIFREYKIKEIDYRYVQVIAMVNNKGNYEFVGYGSYYEKDAIWWKVLLIILAAAIVVGVLVYVFRLYIKRKRDIGRQMNDIEGDMISRATTNTVS